MVANILFPIVAALLPVLVSDFLKGELDQDLEDPTLFVIVGIVSFVLLFVIQLLLDKLDKKLSRINRYCGHWVEEMTLYKKQGETEQAVERMIGIGMIRYDRKTGEYIFVGKTYDLKGEEKYAWTIDYLHADRDDSMQYVCSVQIPGERSIGQITFYNKDECDGTIWIMDGSWYKFNGRRIKAKELYRFGVEPSTLALWWPFYRGMVMRQQDFSEYVHNYSQKEFPPLDRAKGEIPAAEQGGEGTGAAV